VEFENNSDPVNAQTEISITSGKKKLFLTYFIGLFSSCIYFHAVAGLRIMYLMRFSRNLKSILYAVICPAKLSIFIVNLPS
jgi:hypothetical protein